MTQIIIEGGEAITIPDAIANDDAAIVRVITPYFPEAADAELERATDADGNVTIKLTPVGKTKG